MSAYGPEWVPNPCSQDDKWLQELEDAVDKLPKDAIHDMRGFVRSILFYLRNKEKDRVRRIYEQI